MKDFLRFTVWLDAARPSLITPRGLVYTSREKHDGSGLVFNLVRARALFAYPLFPAAVAPKAYPEPDAAIAAK